MKRRGRRINRIVNSTTLRNSFDRRTLVVAGAQAALGTVLAARLGYLAIAQNEKYELESESNRVNLSLITPRRGWILDRNNAPLASNKADFRVDIIPDRMADAERGVDQLASLLELDAGTVSDIKDKISGARGFRPVEVASKLSYDQFAALSVRLPEMPGVVPQRGFSR